MVMEPFMPADKGPTLNSGTDRAHNRGHECELRCPSPNKQSGGIEYMRKTRRVTYLLVVYRLGDKYSAGLYQWHKKVHCRVTIFTIFHEFDQSCSQLRDELTRHGCQKHWFVS